jgi:hypothetical protein
MPTISECRNTALPILNPAIQNVLFFSTETSAHILYRSIMMTGKRIEDITLMDYGAGVGTLFLLRQNDRLQAGNI